MDVRNTKDTVKPENYNWKVLLVADAGLGKTTFVGTAPDVGIAACEPGEGGGTLRSPVRLQTSAVCVMTPSSPFKRNAASHWTACRTW